MKIHQIRNATCVIESDSNFILVDPMLGKKGTLPSFTKFRHPAQANPIVELPDSAVEILEKVTHCLVTHSQTLGIEMLTHTDHFDPAGRKFLKKKQIPVTTLAKDASYMKKHGLILGSELTYWKRTPFLDGHITAVPMIHGKGWIKHLMTRGAGFFLELPNEPSVYIAGDTVYTIQVERALRELKPDVAVIAAGSARLDIGDYILMPKEEILTFIDQAPGQVIANHMEALNHCPTTRAELREELTKRGLSKRVHIPADGEQIELGRTG